MSTQSPGRRGLAQLLLLGLLATLLDGCDAVADERAGKQKPRRNVIVATGDDADAATRPTGSRRGDTRLVAHVVDGDTVLLGNGRYVRLLGMDAPEVGMCGSERATANLVRLVEGRQVRLARGPVDRDRYDRLLRYVDVGSVDAGLRLVKNGLAIARYDSRDGYGPHPREARYVAADRASPDFRCAPAPKPQPLVGGTSGCGGYAPCLPSYPPDLDCPEVNGPITVTGPDPHGLDADHDGVACE